MTLLNNLNIGGTGYGIQNNLPMGTCATPAGTEVKAAAFADSFELSAGNLISVTFTYANTYGDGSTTYPKLTVNGTTYPIKYPTGGYVGNGAWANGQIVTFMCDGTNLIITAPVVDRIDITESSPVSSKTFAAQMSVFTAGTGEFTYIKAGNVNMLHFSCPSPVGNYSGYNLAGKISLPKKAVLSVAAQNSTSGGTNLNNVSITLAMVQLQTTGVFNIYGAIGIKGSDIPYESVLGTITYVS